MNARGFFDSLFDLSFGSFITTRIVKLIYVVIITSAALGALFTLAGGLASRSPSAILFALIAAPVLFLLYVTLGRIWLEVVIVLFRIAENTETLVELSKPQANSRASDRSAEDNATSSQASTVS